MSKSGTRSVQPRETHTFRLYAFAGQASKFLGLATVNVNLAQCISRESSLIDELVAGVLKQEIDKRDDIYFRNGSKPQVTITPDSIRFILRLASVQNNFPDPSVDIDVSFGLGVAADDLVAFRRKLVPVAVNISVDALALGEGTRLADALGAVHDAIVRNGHLAIDVPPRASCVMVVR